ncbi:MAG: hypothetical protein Kow006_16860 [Gammaproteobacteria bacterium]
MEALLGTTIGVYIAVVFVVMGFAAWMTGAAVAGIWKPVWQVVAYCVLLAFASRFLIFALFEGRLLSLSGFVIDALILNLYGLIAFRINRVKTLVKQYPWLYERTSPWSFRERIQTASEA